MYHYLPIHRQDGDKALNIIQKKHTCIQKKHVEVVKLLLDKGADIEAKTNVSHITME
jgi:ankyrin repeat protein